MIDSALPDPLVPAEVDLRGTEYMPLLGQKLFSSDFNLEASDAEFRRALVLWWAAWNQQPAASLPNSERAQAKLAGFEDEKSKTWRAVRGRVLHGFVLCNDGRLYHPVLARQALIAWEKRAEDREERENEAERQRRLRSERKRLFAELRAVGVTPKWDVPMGDLRQLHTTHVTGAVTPHVTPHVTVTGGVTVTQTDTAKTGRDGTGQGIQENSRAAASPTPLRARAEVGVSPEPEDPPADAAGDSPPPGPPPGPPDEPTPAVPTPAGAVCRAMRRVGFAATNPGDPRLAELLRQGATEAEFVGLATEAAAKSKGWAWLLSVLQARRAEAGAIALAPKATAAPSPRAGEAETTARLLAERRAHVEATQTPESRAVASAALAKLRRTMAAGGRS